MTKEQALDVVEKGIDKVFERDTRSVIGCFKTLEECEKESIEFTKEQMKVVGGMLSNDYKTGNKEGVEHYLQKHNNLYGDLENEKCNFEHTGRSRCVCRG